MKSILSLAVASLSIFSAAPILRGQAPAGALAVPAPAVAADAAREAEGERGARVKQQLATKWQVRVDVQMVAMPEQRGIELLAELQADDEKRVEAACARIQEMIRRKEATLLGWPTVTTLDGQRAVVETIDEKRYPTAFEPPDAPANYRHADAEAAKAGAGTPIADNGWFPTAFETRNVGVTLEVEPNVAEDGRRILVNLVPQRVAFLGYETFDAVKTQSGRIVKADQPIFATSKITTSLSTRNGQHILISFHKLTKPEDTVELVILRAVATPTH